MTDCTGGKLDPDTDLCWQDPPNTDGTNWFVAAGIYDVTDNPTTTNYCSGLGAGWRLPTISELRSLFRGCLAVEWDLDWVAVPVDNCGVWDSCLSFTSCHDGPCMPGECSDYGGPDELGCYWDPALQGACDLRYWSLSQETDNANNAWRIYFYTGNTHYNDKSNAYSVRCVRDET
jgi:hypothetical protein